MSKLAIALLRKEALDKEIASLNNSINSIKVSGIDFQSKTAMEKMEMELMKANPLFQRFCDQITVNKAELAGLTTKLSMFQTMVGAHIMSADYIAQLEDELF